MYLLALQFSLNIHERENTDLHKGLRGSQMTLDHISIRFDRLVFWGPVVVQQMSTCMISWTAI